MSRWFTAHFDAGARAGAALNLEWSDIYLYPAHGSKFGYIHVRDGKSRYAKRNLSLTSRVSVMLPERKEAMRSHWVFPGKQTHRANIA